MYLLPNGERFKQEPHNSLKGRPPPSEGKGRLTVALEVFSLCKGETEFAKMRIDLKKCSNDPEHLEDGTLFYKCIRNRLRGIIRELAYTPSQGMPQSLRRQDTQCSSVLV